MGIKSVAIVGGVVAGIVLIAVGMEIFQKGTPGIVKNVEEKLKSAGRAVKDAFEGNEPVEEA